MAASQALWPAADASRLAVPVWNQPLLVLSTTLRLSTLTEEKRNEMKKKSFPGCTSQIPDFSPPGLPHRRRLPQLSLPRFPISIFIGVVSNNLLSAVRGDVQSENPFSFGHIAGQF